MIETRHLPLSFSVADQLDVPRSKEGLTLEALEGVHIVDAIRRHHGNRTAAAKELGINPSTLFRKIKSLGIEMPEMDGRRRPS